MNKEFITKMIKAKKLEIEAIRALLPDKFNSNLDEMGDSIKELLKECIMEMCFSGKTDCNDEKSENEESINSDKAENNSTKKRVNKITIE